MIEGILGTKIGMSRMFTESGDSVAVTLISCGPCWVVDKKGNKLRIGYMETKGKALKKPNAEFFKKKNLPPLKVLKEVKVTDEKNHPEPGEKIFTDIFKPGDKVDVSGISKGKGFAGVMKRWNFRGGPASHGSGFHRSPGSIGGASSPSRVFPGLKMAGRMGSEKVTQMNLEVVAVDVDENILAVKGAVPGPSKSLLYVRKTTRGKNGS